MCKKYCVCMCMYDFIPCTLSECLSLLVRNGVKVEECNAMCVYVCMYECIAASRKEETRSSDNQLAVSHE